MESSRKFFGNDPKNVPENWQCAKNFLLRFGGHFPHGHCTARFVHKARSASRCSLHSRLVTANNLDVIEWIQLT